MITESELKEILHYDQDTGNFIWLVSLSTKTKVGSIAGSNKDGYKRVMINNKRYYLHRLAWLYVNGSYPKKFIDHINGNKGDNRICNLRDVSHSGNMQNRRLTSKNNTSGYLGVCWEKSHKKWRAQITVDGKTIRLGRFKDPKIAHETYLKAKADLHPFQTLVGA